MDIFEAPSEGPPEAATPEEIARFVTAAAVQAPSVHNTQPWWFRYRHDEIELTADNERQLRIADPDGREMFISCGAALFNVRVTLRYLGLVPKVRVVPDHELPNLVARVSWSERVPAVEYEKQLYAQIPRRRTHRGGFDPAPPPPELLAALPKEAAKEKAMLDLMDSQPQRAAVLAAVVEAGDGALRLDSDRAKEEARWAPGPSSHRQDGVPPTAYPAQPERTEPQFTSRDYAHGHGWGLPLGEEDPVVRSAGVVGLLTTSVDQPTDWIRAGQALQRVLLLASSYGVAAALHSQPLELPLLRDFVRVHLSGRAFPQMVLRFGTTSETPQSVRRPVEEVLQESLL
jgi:Nitroreductase family